MKYEYGENLKDLAVEYKIPLITIYKRKKKDTLNNDAWIKGIRKKEGYLEYAKENEKKKEELLETILKEAADELIYYETLEKEQRNKDIKGLDVKVEKAFLTRLERISMKVELKKSLKRVYNDKDQSIIDKIKAELDLKKLEISTKQLEYDKQKKINDYYLKKQRGKQ
ncbi:MAG: hypothetical protein ACRC0S_01570 [Fusobacteriaceae bacterium]